MQLIVGQLNPDGHSYALSEFRGDELIGQILKEKGIWERINSSKVICIQVNYVILTYVYGIVFSVFAIICLMESIPYLCLPLIKARQNLCPKECIPPSLFLLADAWTMT